MTDVFDIQDEIVASIVDRPRAGAARRGGAGRAAVDGEPEAYELYLKGRHFWNQRSPA